MAHVLRPVLRLEWVIDVAEAVNAFATSLPLGGVSAASVDAFAASLPPAETELERRFIRDLREGLCATRPCAVHLARAEHARALLSTKCRAPWTLASLARAVGCNRTTLQQEFQRLTGTTVHRYLVRQRVSEAQRLLAVSDVKASRVCAEVGFRSASAFGRHFKRLTGVTVSEFRTAPSGRLPIAPEFLPNERAIRADAPEERWDVSRVPPRGATCRPRDTTEGNH